jgi:hypothetical protein
VTWLQKQILNRLNSRFYMQLPETTAWHHPETVRPVMNVLTPIHVIVLTQKSVVVDGLEISSQEGWSVKQCAVNRSVAAVYGPQLEEARLSNDYLLAANKAGIYTVTEQHHDYNYDLFQLSFLAIPSIPIADSHIQLLEFLPKIKASYRDFVYGKRKRPMPLGIAMDVVSSRFAVEAQLSNIFCEPEYHKTFENSAVEHKQTLRLCAVGIAVHNAKNAVITYVSRQFYKKPTPQNVVTLGDLCFLSQMRKDWNVARIVYPLFSPHSSWNDSSPYPSYYLAEALKRTVGIESFKRYCRVRKLLTTAFNPEIEAIWLELATAVGATR